ncbi:PREDICTED: uncharacterized protein LOC104824530 [Tarenaya hassleriana]|uniref:uncharacterized protein LOC104824530 n=1 Tax=Tarenaya hassleriana TaxID=28532 RepID=UPI00053C118A|nr:PREDICTED: uncharacterized protein LOC104824530 [Tarenaya hassleriana]
METVSQLSIIFTLLVTTFIASPISGRDIVVNRFDDYVADPPEGDIFVDPPQAEYDEKLLTHFPTGYKEFLENCSSKMSTKCGTQLFKVMFEDTEVTRECCVSLLRMGRTCHVALVDTVFRTYEYKDDADVGFPRSRVAWNVCARDYGEEIGAPVPLEHLNVT